MCMKESIIHNIIYNFFTPQKMIKFVFIQPHMLYFAYPNDKKYPDHFTDSPTFKIWLDDYNLVSPY